MEKNGNSERVKEDNYWYWRVHSGDGGSGDGDQSADGTGGAVTYLFW